MTQSVETKDASLYSRRAGKARHTRLRQRHVAMPPLRSGVLRLTEARSGIPARSAQQIPAQQFTRSLDAIT